ncbi:hypothetical protein I5398_24925 [Citrobacter freundii]|nr:hypothetical protein [Citrobacter freundii]
MHNIQSFSAGHPIARRKKTRASGRLLGGQGRQVPFQLSQLNCILFSVLFATPISSHGEAEFNPAFLEGLSASNSADLSVFQQPNAQAPGRYRVDI